MKRTKFFISIIGSREVMIQQSICLEKGVTYTIRLDFIRYRGDRLSVDASVLVDSVSPFIIVSLIYP